MKIHRKHRSQNEILVWTLFWGPFLLAPLLEFLRLPGAVKYLLDVSWVLLFLTMVTRRKRKIDRTARGLVHWVVCFFLLTLLNYLVNFQSVFYYLWGLRNNFRGYVLFFAVIYYFSEEEADKALGWLDRLFYGNALLMLVQFFALGYQQDNLGGIFGVRSGCNGYVNLFFCIVLSVSFIQYVENKKRFQTFAAEIVLMLILAALAELKFFYVEFIILIVAGILCSRFSWKKLMTVAVAAMGILIGYRVFVWAFPGVDLSLAGLYAYASSEKGYTSSGDLNRLAFVGTIDKYFLPTITDRLFGLGLGNCDYATGRELVTSPFSIRYGFLHYGWMSTAFMYLENGWIGLILFFGFFLCVGAKSLRMAKKPAYNRTHCLIAALCCVAAVLNGFYNISLRIESGYMLYFVLAIPWCRQTYIHDCGKPNGREMQSEDRHFIDAKG